MKLRHALPGAIGGMIASAIASYRDHHTLEWSDLLQVLLVGMGAFALLVVVINTVTLLLHRIPTRSRRNVRGGITGGKSKVAE